MDFNVRRNRTDVIGATHTLYDAIALARGSRATDPRLFWRNYKLVGDLHLLIAEHDEIVSDCKRVMAVNFARKPNPKLEAEWALSITRC